MPFSKEIYWKLRNAGQRGQGTLRMRSNQGLVMGVVDTKYHEAPGSGNRKLVRPFKVQGRGRRRRSEIRSQQGAIDAN